MAFANAKKGLLEFLYSKGISNVDVVLSDTLRKVNKVSGKFNHVYKELDKK